MLIKNLNLLDEGSWALMIEESNVRALQRHHGSMAQLEITRYLSIGTKRYYKAYFDDEQLDEIRNGIVRFLLDESSYRQCVGEIQQVLDRMAQSQDLFAELELHDQFHLYCDILCDYIAYYNSVITDAFYVQVFDVVDAEIPPDFRFAARALKDALFATDNEALLTHQQTVDMLAMSQAHLDGNDVADDIDEFVERYRATTISSGSPNGMGASEVRDHLGQQTSDSVRSEKAFLDNLHLRYGNSAAWSERTASAIELGENTHLLVKNAADIAYVKIRMREEFQKFKITVRRGFLNELIAQIGKSEFDYMRIHEIADFIARGTRVSNAEIAKRQELTVFQLTDGRIDFRHEVPSDVALPSRPDTSQQELTGEVLTGSGKKRYRIKKVEQHEQGLTSFDEFIRTSEAKHEVAVITNVLRPYLVPKLREFGALLTQYGGYTSHASVLCRELGINSMIGVDGLLDGLETDDLIEVDFGRGTVRKLDGPEPLEPEITDTVVDLNGDREIGSREVGAKAANLMKAAQVAPIAAGFVVRGAALQNVDDAEVHADILRKLEGLACDRVVVRSSHESEDGAASSYAGLFESYIDVDAGDADRVIHLVKSVCSSQDAESVNAYGDARGSMSVIVQEMVSPDISGVLLTSNVFEGYDYMLIEYVVGHLSHLVQGEVTPLSSYIKKRDVVEGRATYQALPAILTQALEDSFRPLADMALNLERLFDSRLEIEWGLKDGAVYIFQARPY